MENKWHLSEYNIFSSNLYNNKIPCVNLLKGTYSELDINDVGKLYDLQSINNIEKELQGFIRQGIIVNFNEKAFLINEALRINLPTYGSLNITIAVTTKCNFNCPYCFEFHNGGKMSLEVQEQTVNFIINLLKLSNSKRIHITWYGGEPLLAVDVIKNISEKIIQYVDDNNIFYSTNIVTNGYLLNQEKIDILESMRITSFQVTLDGLEENHNKTRSLINGQPTFNKIIDNLYKLKFSSNIHIRHNVHKDNLKDEEGLRKLIRDINLKSKNKISYGQGILVNNPAEKREKTVNYLDNEYISKVESTKFARELKNGGCFFCSAQRMWGIVIEDDGSLYKCWEDIGKKERSFGKVNNWNPINPYNNITNLNSLLIYSNSLPIFDKECNNCVWLPLCKGGCPSKRIYHNIKCLSFKNNPDLFIDKVREFYHKD